MHDTGIDETNYDGNGAVAIAPDRYTDVNGSTCVLDEPATHAYDQNYFFKVRALPAGPAQRWGFLDQWRYKCTGSGGSQTLPVIINFRTAQGLGCATPVDVPAPSPPTMSGAFTMTCSPGWTGTMVWSFAP